MLLGPVGVTPQGHTHAVPGGGGAVRGGETQGGVGALGVREQGGGRGKVVQRVVPVEKTDGEVR